MNFFDSKTGRKIKNRLQFWKDRNIGNSTPRTPDGMRIPKPSVWAKTALQERIEAEEVRGNIRQNMRRVRKVVLPQKGVVVKGKVVYEISDLINRNTRITVESITPVFDQKQTYVVWGNDMLIEDIMASKSQLDSSTVLSTYEDIMKILCGGELITEETKEVFDPKKTDVKDHLDLEKKVGKASKVNLAEEAEQTLFIRVSETPHEGKTIYSLRTYQGHKLIPDTPEDISVSEFVEKNVPDQHGKGAKVELAAALDYMRTKEDQKRKIILVNEPEDALHIAENLQITGFPLLANTTDSGEIYIPEKRKKPSKIQKNLTRAAITAASVFFIGSYIKDMIPIPPTITMETPAGEQSLERIADPKINRNNVLSLDHKGKTYHYVVPTNLVASITTKEGKKILNLSEKKLDRATKLEINGIPYWLSHGLKVTIDGEPLTESATGRKVNYGIIRTNTERNPVIRLYLYEDNYLSTIRTTTKR